MYCNILVPRPSRRGKGVAWDTAIGTAERNGAGLRLVYIE